MQRVWSTYLENGVLHRRERSTPIQVSERVMMIEY